MQFKYGAFWGICFSALGAVSHASAKDAARTSGATTAEQALRLPGTVSPWMHRATKIGSADESKRVVITAFLRWKDEPQLEQRLQAVSTPGNAQYGEFLSPEEFHAVFAPDHADVAKVQAGLQALGFRVEQTPASGLFVRASGTVAQIEHAFGVSQNLYSYRGQTLRSHAEDPLLPASLAGLVTYIGGLDDSQLLKHSARVVRPLQASAPLAPSPGIVQPPYGFPALSPCSHYWGDNQVKLTTAAPFPYGNGNLPWIPCGYTPQQVRQAYGTDKVNERGYGITIAITDVYASPTIVEDVDRYARNHDLPLLTPDNFTQLLQPGATTVPANDPCGYQGWWGEETLDVTAVHAVAPHAHILYVGGACDAVDSPDDGVAIEPIYQVIDERLADIVSNSWLYDSEAALSAGQLASDNAEFIQAALQGMTVLFASGDDGDLTMVSGDFGPNPVASGTWPPTSPYVTAVGGTSVLLKNAAGEKSDYGWANYLTIFNDPLVSANGKSVNDQGQGWISPFIWGGGSGGGPSLVMAEPFYQRDVVPLILATQTHAADGTLVTLNPPRRVTPDIAMLADIHTGFLVGETYLKSTPPSVDAGCSALSATTEYCESPAGGTSVATPLFGALMALVNEHRNARGRGPIGFVNIALYSLPVGGEGSNAPIIDVNAPTKPISALGAYAGINDFTGFVSLDSNPDADGTVIENVDSSLRSAPGYDNVTGLGTPNAPEFIRALER